MFPTSFSKKKKKISAAISGKSPGIMPVVKKVFKFVNYGILAAVGTSTAVALHNNDYDLSSLGIMRFGRALLTVSLIIILKRLSSSVYVDFRRPQL